MRLLAVGRLVDALVGFAVAGRPVGLVDDHAVGAERRDQALYVLPAVEHHVAVPQRVPRRQRELRRVHREAARRDEAHRLANEAESGFERAEMFEGAFGPHEVGGDVVEGVEETHVYGAESDVTLEYVPRETHVRDRGEIACVLTVPLTNRRRIRREDFAVKPCEIGRKRLVPYREA